MDMKKYKCLELLLDTLESFIKFLYAFIDVVKAKCSMLLSIIEHTFYQFTEAGVLLEFYST